MKVLWIDPREGMKDQGKPIQRWIMEVFEWVLILIRAFWGTSWICLPQNKRGKCLPIDPHSGLISCGPLRINSSHFWLACVHFPGSVRHTGQTQGKRLSGYKDGSWLMWLEGEVTQEGFLVVPGGSSLRGSVHCFQYWSKSPARSQVSAALNSYLLPCAFQVSLDMPLSPLCYLEGLSAFSSIIFAYHFGNWSFATRTRIIWTR